MAQNIAEYAPRAIENLEKLVREGTRVVSTRSRTP
jgi:hypothetical protein